MASAGLLWSQEKWPYHSPSVQIFAFFVNYPGKRQISVYKRFRKFFRVLWNQSKESIAVNMGRKMLVPENSSKIHSRQNFQKHISKGTEGNFLVLHRASPSAHNVATSKGAMIFTCRLKRGTNFAPFSNANSLHRNIDNSTRLKRCLSWNLPQSPRSKWLFKVEIVLLLSFCETWTVIPIFYLCFLLFMATKNIYIQEKSLDSRSCVFLDMDDTNFRI